MARIQFCVAVLALSLGASALRIAPADTTAPAKKEAAHAKEATKADVEALHKRLELMAGGLEGMLSKTGSLSKTKVASTLGLFLKRLRVTLADTKAPTDYAKAMKSLLDAKAGIAMLTKDLVKQQENLIRDDAEQKESLLLGVLMSHQKDSMAEQLKIIESDDFSQLPVAKALLANHSDKTALFAQVADYLDKHSSGMKSDFAIKAQDSKAHIEAVVSDLDRRVEKLQKYEDEDKARHEKTIKSLTDAENKASTKQEKHMYKSMIKKKERQYKKSYALSHEDLLSMKEAAAAVRKGDLKALSKAKAALEKTTEALNAQSGNFLHLL